MRTSPFRIWGTGNEELWSEEAREIAQNDNITDDVLVLGEDASVVEARTIQVRALADIIQNEMDVSNIRSNIDNLQQVSAGIESLMLDVDIVTNGDEIKPEEIQVLSAAARAVRREYLEPEHREVLDDIIEGRLEGSQEGLMDAIKSIGTKISFAMGNFKDKISTSKKTGEDLLKAYEANLTALDKRISEIKVAQFSVTLKGDTIAKLRVGDKLDIVNDIKQLPVMLKAVTIDDMAQASTAFDKMQAFVKKAALSKDAEEFVANTKGFEQFPPMLIPSGVVKQMAGEKYRNFIIDVYRHKEISPGGFTRFIAIQRPTKEDNHLENVMEQAFACSRQFSGWWDMGYDAKSKKPEPQEVTLTKADMTSMLNSLKDTLKIMRTYNNGLTAFATMFKQHEDIVAIIKEKSKDDWVDKKINSTLINLSNSLNAPLDLGYIYTAPTFGEINKIVAIVKHIVYKSDLSNKDENKE